MGNTAVSQRKSFDAVRVPDGPNDADCLDSSVASKLIPPAKRARSKYSKANNAGGTGIGSSAGVNNSKLHVAKKANIWKKNDYYYPAMIPEPDYSDSEEENSERKSSSNKIKGHRSSSKQQPVAMTANGSPMQLSDDGLVVPKKLANPCLESQERQNLHKELMFNKKIGKSVLGQKTELQKAMEKFRDEQKKKELEGEKINKRSSFEKRLEEQASKIKNLEDDQKKPDDVAEQSEFLRIHARVRAHTMPVDTES